MNSPAKRIPLQPQSQPAVARKLRFDAPQHPPRPLIVAIKRDGRQPPHS